MSVKVSLNTLYFPNSNPKFIDATKSVHKHFNLKVNYWEMSARHGAWMDHVINNTDSEVVGFLDIDCVPLTDTAINEIIVFVAKNKSIAGCAQASNHLPPMTHIFIAPCCFFVWKPLHTALGNISFSETTRSDVCEELCYVAEENGVRMKALYPTHFEREAEEGVWRLHNYGLYGVGTVFANKFYHLYQSRFQSNVDLFIERCKQIVDGTFTTEGMFSSTDFDFKGRICNFEQEEKMRSNIKGKI
jgi:hypothetical protein